jgi:pimeloyl-ACP methyl ester carboxylesterase
VIDTVESRQLIALDEGGPVLCGTYHRVPNDDGASKAEKKEMPPLGIFFLNSLTLPRTATGDSSVYWADSFAKFGYPSFRFDLPGLGDSQGELPLDGLDFMNSGGFGPVIAAKMTELTQRYNLSGVVLVGHCAGAVSAIYAAAACKDCEGLVLMDPYFHLKRAVRPWIREQLSAWARRSRLGRLSSAVYDFWGDLWLSAKGNRVPQNANIPLLKCWKQIADSGLPILLLKAPGLKAVGVKPRLGDFDYVSYVVGFAARRGRVTVTAVENTDHSFANRAGREGIRQYTENWLLKYFPQTSSGEVAADSHTSRDACDGVCAPHEGSQSSTLLKPESGVIQ